MCFIIFSVTSSWLHVLQTLRTLIHSETAIAFCPNRHRLTAFFCTAIASYLGTHKCGIQVVADLVEYQGYYGLGP